MPKHTSEPPENDRNFDDLAQRFARTIYDSPRGAMRLAALKADFESLALVRRGARVLDVGGGQGQFALWLAQQGVQVSLCDISEAMLAVARQAFAEANCALDARCCAVQDLSAVYHQRFDLVLNHAVLEWLVDPFAALPMLTDRVDDGGYLSLMFYNLHGHRWRQLMIGRVHDPDGANERLRNTGNSPGVPLDPAKVEQHLHTLGFKVIRWRGIRSIHDHMHQKIRERTGEQALLEADLHYGLQDPYRQLGRYVHFVAKKASSDRSRSGSIPPMN